MGLAQRGVNGIGVGRVLGAAGQRYLALMMLHRVRPPGEDNIVLPRPRIEEYQHRSLPVIHSRLRPWTHVVVRTSVQCWYCTPGTPQCVMRNTLIASKD